MGPHSEATAPWWRLSGIWEFAETVSGRCRGGAYSLVTPLVGRAMRRVDVICKNRGPGVGVQKWDFAILIEI
jgi:hypothetical protein